MQDASLYVPLAAHSCKRIELASEAIRKRTLLRTKECIQFDLDEFFHAGRSVLEQSRDDYVIYLPLRAT
jgi:hypothetical protein